MSTPSDEPEPRDPGDVPSGSERPAPGQPSRGQEPGQPFPTQPAAGSAGFAFEMPADRPRSFGEVLPRGGFSGTFDVTGLPTELKVSYWIWVVGGVLGLLGGVIGLFGVLVLFAIIPGVAILLFLLVLVALALAAAEIVLADVGAQLAELVRCGTWPPLTRGSGSNTDFLPDTSLRAAFPQVGPALEYLSGMTPAHPLRGTVGSEPCWGGQASEPVADPDVTTQRTAHEQSSSPAFQ